MMPATLTAPHLSPVPFPTKPVTLSDLSNMERAVALYASDMPNSHSYKRGDDPQLEAWIIQGVTRLGRAEVRRRASFLAGHRKLWLRDMTTREIDRRHQARFPSKSRLGAAESLATATVLSIGVAPAARELPIVIDGPCPKCDGVGKLWVNQVIDEFSGEYEEAYVPCWVCRDGGVA